MLDTTSAIEKPTPALMRSIEFKSESATTIDKPTPVLTKSIESKPESELLKCAREIKENAERLVKTSKPSDNSDSLDSHPKSRKIAPLKKNRFQHDHEMATEIEFKGSDFNTPHSDSVIVASSPIDRTTKRQKIDPGLPQKGEPGYVKPKFGEPGYNPYSPDYSSSPSPSLPSKRRSSTPSTSSSLHLPVSKRRPIYTPPHLQGREWRIDRLGKHIPSPLSSAALSGDDESVSSSFYEVGCKCDGYGFRDCETEEEDDDGSTNTSEHSTLSDVGSFITEDSGEFGCYVDSEESVSDGLDISAVSDEDEDEKDDAFSVATHDILMGELARGEEADKELVGVKNADGDALVVD